MSLIRLLSSEELYPIAQRIIRDGGALEKECSLHPPPPDLTNRHWVWAVDWVDLC